MSRKREPTGAWGMQTTDQAAAPKALVLATQDWPLTAFIAIGLRRGGFAVVGLCPGDHVLRQTAAVDRCFRFSNSRRLRSLLRAIRHSSPTILVPGDDQSVYAIYDLHARCLRDGGTEAGEIVRLIERSVGDPASYPIARSKSALIRLARECGVRIPGTTELANAADLKAHCDAATPPFVLKQDGTFGGLGVIVARTKREAESAFRRLNVRVMVNAGRQLLFKGNHKPLAALLTSPSPAISVQQFIEGRPANRAVLCWRGRVLAGATVMTLEADPFPNGPATVVEFIRNPEIDRAVETLVAHLGLSGFCGFDFILDRETGYPFLLELNPRATSACWLGTRPHSDLCAALFRALGDDGTAANIAATTNVPDSDEEPSGEKAALFPQEWMRSNTSPHLAAPYHRVPWQDPRLVSFLTRAAFKGRRHAEIGFISRLARRLVLGRNWQLDSGSGEGRKAG